MIMGLGNCSDGREGSQRLMGTNLPITNKMFASAREGVLWQVGSSAVKLEVFVDTDVSAFRHSCEHLANAG